MTDTPVTPKRKLIEVALPLEEINKEAAREKSIRHGHPSTLHLWWARRPLAAARAVLFAQLVDDPSARPEEFPTEAAQRAERERLHGIIKELVVWENATANKNNILGRAHAEILKSTGGNPPPILDPFCGGGTIPLEAQRLGLEAHGSDLNPVAVLITKALIEIPPKFAGRPPVFPGTAGERLGDWPKATGLAEDVRRYGSWMRDEAEKRIGHLYPKAMLPDGSKATVIAWIWARTVTCPNPACRIRMPLVRSWWLGKKKGKEAYVVPSVQDGQVRFTIGHDPATAPGTPGGIEDGTMYGRTGTVCIGCGTAAETEYVRTQGIVGGLGTQLMAVVAEGDRRRIYLPPTPEHEAAAGVSRPDDVPDGHVATNPRWFSPPAYGLTDFADLFTNRQLTALTTFSDLVGEARGRALADALAGGMPEGERLADGGTGAAAYADAVATYLGMAVSKLTDRNSGVVNWYVSRESTSSTFARQAIPITWDFAEVQVLGENTGSWENSYGWTAETIEPLGVGVHGHAAQVDASSRSYAGALISTDPPYYDNIGYSDLSDFFYVWLRRSLRDVHPDLLSTMLVPKAEELVANPYRHNGKEGAEQFFEQGFRKVFANACAAASENFPITVFYAFKQSEKDEAGTASTGWQTLLEGMIDGGWAITGTWPMRSELGNRMLASGTNALASSIVLSLRPRPADAPTTDRRGLIAALQAELPAALRTLQQGTIAPVDLPQAAIGPGMAVFSRYAKVLEPDGSRMSVRSALARINEILDQVLSEQEGDFDDPTRFAITWYRQHGYATGQFGDADNIARARNTSVEIMDRSGILTSRAGKVTLIRPADMPAGYDVIGDAHVSTWEALHHLILVLATDGVPAAGALLGEALSRPDGAIEADAVKELAFLLFSIAEKNSWTKDALAFNTLATSWPEIVDASRAAPAATSQPTLTFDKGDD